MGKITKNPIKIKQVEIIHKIEIKHTLNLKKKLYLGTLII